MNFFVDVVVVTTNSIIISRNVAIVIVVTVNLVCYVFMLLYITKQKHLIFHRSLLVKHRAYMYLQSCKRYDVRYPRGQPLPYHPT